MKVRIAICSTTMLSYAILAHAQSVGPLRVSRPAPQAVPAQLLLSDALTKGPLHTFPAAATGAIDQLNAMKAWNAARRVPVQNGFARRFPLPIKVNLSGRQGGASPRSESGGFRTDSETGSAWGTRIHVADAHRLRLHLVDVQLPPGTAMWVWGVGERPRPFGLELLGPSGDLWSPSVGGQDLLIEVHTPRGSTGHLALREVMELFRLDAVLPAPLPQHTGTSPARNLPWLMPEAASESPDAVLPKDDSAACLVDLTCVPLNPPLPSLEDGVAQLTFIVETAAYLCSGGLLNDTVASGTPYLLTAHHCFSDQTAASTLEAVFQYHDTTCDEAFPDESEFPQTNGATLLATGATDDTSSDFTFVRLTGTLPNSSILLGWNANASALTDGASLYRISHPAPGGIPFPQSVSTTQFAASGTECQDANRPNYIYSTKVTGSGDIAGGSSGSPVVLGNGQVVGQLLGQCPASSPYDNCDPNNTVIDGAFSQTFPAIAQWLSPSSGSGLCIPSDTTLCVDDQPGDQRFQIQVTVNTSEGQGLHGPGSDIALSSLGISHGGIFWFFSPTNPEMLIKVLNGCSLGGHYWIFFAALTNVGYSVTVTDTVTGHSRTYTNSDNTTAAPVQDTSALPCS